MAGFSSLVPQISLDPVGLRSDESWCKERNQMPHTRKQTKDHNGFETPLQPDTELGLAMLIAEDEEGQYERVAVASTINEAKELAESDLRSRMRRLERGDDPGICPFMYKLWARGMDGHYRLAYEIGQADVIAK
jgi:hypothetical protein